MYKGLYIYGLYSAVYIHADIQGVQPTLSSEVTYSYSHLQYSTFVTRERSDDTWLSVQ